VAGYTLSAESVVRNGLRGTLARVRLADDVPQPHRHLADVLEIISASDLATSVKGRAEAIFRRLAEAEATVHGVPIEQVHFHEVGAVDAIVDVVGVAIALDYLGIEHVVASSVPTG